MHDQVAFLIMAGLYTTKLAYMVIKLETKVSENVMKSFYNLKKNFTNDPQRTQMKNQSYFIQRSVP